jgi:hypothetical protein
VQVVAADHLDRPVTGPALLDAPDTTVWVPPAHRAALLDDGTLVVERADAS